MRNFILFTFLFLLVQCTITRISELYQTYNSNDYLYWSEERKLNWNDFQGEPIETDKIACEAIFLYPTTAERVNLFSTTDLSAICVFDKKKSWVKKEFVTDNLLLYNQVIFDIYELHVRMLRKEFMEKEISLDNSTEQFHILTEKNNHSLIDEIQKFRVESKLGEIESVIRDWSITIEKRLDDYKDYKIIYVK